MSLAGCPGAKRIRAAFPDEFSCACGEKVEMWPDDFELRCPSCGRTVRREIPPACIEWCAAARECVGETLYEKYVKAKEKRSGESIKEKLLDAMRSFFGSDGRRILHAERVAAIAEEILKRERGRYGVVLAAGILHDIGIPAAERKYGSADAEAQEREGPPLARGILEAEGVEQGVIEEVCDIIGRHHSPRAEESDNFKIVYDADRIANMVEVRDSGGEKGALDAGGTGLLTKAGRELANSLLAKATEEGERGHQ